MADYFESLLEKAKKKQQEQQAAAKSSPTSQPSQVQQSQPIGKKLEQVLDQKMPNEKQMAKKLEELKMPEQLQGSRVHWVLESKKQQAEAAPATGQFEKTKKSAVAKYGEVTIYRVEGSHLLHYEVPVPKPARENP